MESLPLVSIIIPCYNHQQFVKDSLESILGQTYGNMEVLICDDCSIDESYRIIKEYEIRLNEKCKRVVILRNTLNLGVTKNINRMLNEAKGEYVKIIASDDVLCLNAIEEMVSYMEQENADVLIANGLKIDQEQHFPRYKTGEKIYESKPDFSSSDLLEKLFLCNNIFAPGAFIRRSVYDKYGMYDEAIGIEDYEFWLRIVSKSSIDIIYFDSPLVYYRINDNSITSTVANEKLEKRRIYFHTEEMKILEKYRKSIPQKIYIQGVWNRLIGEKRFAVDNELHKLNEILDKEFTVFLKSNKISIIEKVYYKLKFQNKR